MELSFEKYLKEKTALPDSAINTIKGLAIPLTVNKNEFLLQPGEVCRHKIFVETGLLRTFSIGDDGNEHTLQLSPELSWTLDVESYDCETPTRINIGAIEPSNVLLWRKADFNTLLHELPLLKKYSEQVISNNIYFSRQRILTTLGGTPKDKYEEFTQRFPHLLSRLPLRIIASYLGISVKTLTRIRHAQLHP
ncbi:Crp/Fnr family transcriptional regulator [Flavobacterium rhizosphaerae]|uniref:cAMP-binding domain of CRP or a regulatory subunit of cAMP-dependent protein kinases n=1 Tax=Flavobacterium rhizosphaerae TaxID=3163298 RepID=A0ABW8YUT6_9FLAO